MKYLAVSAMALVLVLTSCTKEEVMPVEESVAIENVEKAPTGRLFYDNGADPGTDGVDYGCKGSGNCLDEVVVYGLANQQVIGELVDTIGSGNVEAVQATFKEHARELSRYIPGELIEGVVHGSLYVKSRGALKRSHTIYLNFMEENGKTKSVTPLKL